MRPIKFPLFIITLLCCAGPQTVSAAGPAQLFYQRGAGLVLTGAVGTVYAIQSTTNLGRADAWQCERQFEPSASPCVVPGTADCATGNRFYRAVAVSRTNMVFISPGSFSMGSPGTEQDRYPDEGPQTVVTLSQGFWVAAFPVTQREYQLVMTNNPSHFTGDLNRPVERVTWHDATNYCALLTQREVVSGQLPAGLAYRLPTEAEWEYACRAGTTTRFYFGDDPGYSNLAGHAWYWSNSGEQTHPVGQKPANPWGLYDMCGNVWEWCQSWYGAYPGGAVADPKGPATGQFRVLRGGSWDDPAWNARSACRYGDDPGYVCNFYGFRVVLTVTGD